MPAASIVRRAWSERKRGDLWQPWRHDPIAVVGPGGVGGFVAGALARSGREVTVVAREATAELIATGGLWVRSVALDDDFIARPRAVSELSEPTDVLLVATKASGLADVLRRIRTTPGLVVPLLNGVEHMAVAARALWHRTGRGRRDPDRVRPPGARPRSSRPAPGRASTWPARRTGSRPWPAPG